MDGGLTEVGDGHHVWDAEKVLNAIHHGTGGWASHICAEIDTKVERVSRN